MEVRDMSKRYQVAPVGANRTRVKNAGDALKGYQRIEPDKEANLTDLLTDLRHYCDSQGLDFADADRRAYQHYLEEKHS